MKKHILIALLSMFIFTIHDAFAQESSNKTGEFKVKLPNGLYLYQPKTNAEPFSPLFIVDNGKLIDPYALRDSIGMEKFDKEYVKGKGFNVYAGSELIGTLSDLIIMINNPEKVEEYSSDIVGYGKYSGGPLPGEVSDGSLFANDFNTEFGTIKAVLSPQTFKYSKKWEEFKVTEEDAKRAKDAVRKRYSSYAKGIIAKILVKEKRKIIAESRSSLDFLTAIDLDGNGKKELIGNYSFSYRYVDDKDPINLNDSGLYSIELLFVLWDSGKAEKVLAGMESLPAFSLGGIIDLDGDGVYELIVQESVSFSYEYNAEIDYEGYSPDGKRIEVLKHSPSGWKKVFDTVTVTSRIN
ncbi:MAG: hypothetical protein HY956_00070 [Deltaproteobacteria bacterium]|nr:hypothetical protein [Deltaproteobacteria bacterium]